MSQEVSHQEGISNNYFVYTWDQMCGCKVNLSTTEQNISIVSAFWHVAKITTTISGWFFHFAGKIVWYGTGTVLRKKNG